VTELYAYKFVLHEPPLLFLCIVVAPDLAAAKALAVAHAMQHPGHNAALLDRCVITQKSLGEPGVLGWAEST